MITVCTSDGNLVKRIHAKLNLSFGRKLYNWLMYNHELLKHTRLDLSELLLEVGNPEDNIEYKEEGRKTHQEELVNSVTRRLRENSTF